MLTLPVKILLFWETLFQYADHVIVIEIGLVGECLVLAPFVFPVLRPLVAPVRQQYPAALCEQPCKSVSLVEFPAPLLPLPRPLARGFYLRLAIAHRRCFGASLLV